MSKNYHFCTGWHISTTFEVGSWQRALIFRLSGVNTFSDQPVPPIMSTWQNKNTNFAKTTSMNYFFYFSILYLIFLSVHNNCRSVCRRLRAWDNTRTTATELKQPPLSAGHRRGRIDWLWRQLGFGAAGGLTRVWGMAKARRCGRPDAAGEHRRQRTRRRRTWASASARQRPCAWTEVSLCGENVLAPLNRKISAPYHEHVSKVVFMCHST
jgi:hypothetical protein